MGASLITDLSESLALLDSAIDEVGRCGERYSQAEHDYKVALAKKALELKNTGMAVTLINLVIYGQTADERLRRDVCETQYKTAQEKIQVLKLKCRLLDAQIAREWGK